MSAPMLRRNDSLSAPLTGNNMPVAYFPTFLAVVIAGLLPRIGGVVVVMREGLSVVFCAAGSRDNQSRRARISICKMFR